MSHRSLRFALWLPALAVMAVGARGALAANDPVELKVAEGEVTTLSNQVKDKKKPNEDLIGTVSAVHNAFFHIAPLPDEAPKDPGADAAEDAKKEFAVKQKAYEAAQKAWQEKVIAFQDVALDQLFKALKVVELTKQKDNARTDVNLKAAQALGEILASPDLAKFRDQKGVEKLRAERARQLMDVLTNEFGKMAGTKEYQIAVGVLEATFAALGKTNEPKALDWMLKEYTHTRGGQFEEERLVAAHKAMKLFTGTQVVPGSKRHEIVKTFITNYAGTEANALATGGGSDPKQRAAAQAAKAFWDKIKTGVIDVINYYATAPGGGQPTKDGQGMTTLKELNDWWRDNDNMKKAPWVDPKEPAKDK